MDKNRTLWEIVVDYATKSKFKKFNKEHPKEFDSCFANLNKLKVLLDGGHKIGSFKAGFFRSEANGLYRIGQTGVPAAKESRLYIYPNESDCKIYILTIGTKETQKKDIRDAKKQINNIESGED